MENHDLAGVSDHQFTLNSFTSDVEHNAEKFDGTGSTSLMENVTVSVADSVIDAARLVASFSNGQAILTDSALTSVSASGGGIGHVTLSDISSNLRRIASGPGGLLTGTVISPESLRAVSSIFQSLPDSLTQQRSLTTASVANAIAEAITNDLHPEGGSHNLSVGINLVAGSLGALSEKEVGRTSGLNEQSALSMGILQATDNPLSAMTSGANVVFTTSTHTSSLVGSETLGQDGDAETITIGDTLQVNGDDAVTTTVPSSSLLVTDSHQMIVGNIDGVEHNDAQQMIVGNVEGVHVEHNEARQLIVGSVDDNEAHQMIVGNVEGVVVEPNEEEVQQIPVTCRITSQDLARLVQTVEHVTADIGGDLGENSDVSAETVSLVHVGNMPNVELSVSSTGQLVVRQGSLVYTQDGDNLIRMTHDEAGNLATVEDGSGTVAVASSGAAPPQQEEPTTKVKKPVATKKGKGGWPKGKKRKKDIIKMANAPRPPSTAYVMFLNDQRSDVRASHPELVGPKVAAFLGHMWSSLSAEEKKKYLELEKKDKERYIKDIKEYQETSSCQAFFKKRSRDGISAFIGSEGDMVDELSSLNTGDVLGCNNLHCKVCDVYFSSNHNMTQHILGKQHMHALASKICEMDKETLGLKELEEEEAKGHGSGGSGDCRSCECFREGMPHTEGFRSTFMELHYERELELRELRRRHAVSMHEQLAMRRNFKELQDTLSKVENDHRNLKAIGSNLQSQLDGLYRMILFLT